MTDEQTTGSLMGSYLLASDPGGVRASLFDSDGLPTTLAFYREWPLSATGVVFDARVTKVDTANDQAFLDLGSAQAVLPVRRAKHLADKAIKGCPIGIGDCVTEGAMIRVQGVADALPGDNKLCAVTARPRLVGRYAIVEQGAAAGASGGPNSGGANAATLKVNPSKSLAPNRSDTLTKALKAAHTGSETIILRNHVSGVDDAVVMNEVTRHMTVLHHPLSDKPQVLYQPDPLSDAVRDCPATTTSLITTLKDISPLTRLTRQTYPDLADLKIAQDEEGEAVETLIETIEEALSDKIALPSGGSLSLHHTPALTAVDVNLGNAFQGQSAAQAKRQTNMEAALALAYHLRFQNIGGLIVVDFINMTGRGAAKDLMDLLDEALSDDSVPVQHGGISQFGLMELSRSRSGLSLRDHMLSTTPQPLRAEEAVIALLAQAEKLGLTAEPGTLVITTTQAMRTVLEATPHLLERLKASTARTIALETGTPAAHLAL